MSVATIEDIIVVDPFIIHSKSCNEYILYLISVRLHKYFAKYLNNCDDNNRTVEIGKLETFVHDGVYKAIKFKAYAGKGYRLPRIHHNERNE